MGVNEGQTPTVIVIHAPHADGNRAETAALSAVRDLNSIEPAQTLSAHDPERVRAFFDVTEAELAATSGTLADIVLERVALLEVEK
jgi:KEOPS complex subunit Cgi121